MSGVVSNEGTLRGRVAVVAGATRGAGRGIAAALGEAGATVVCTGRSSRAGGSPRPTTTGPRRSRRRPSWSPRSAASASPIAVDHLDPDQVAALAERIRDDHGHIDVLVNDIWGGELLKGGPPQWNTPIWELDLDDGLRILRLAIDTHLITSHHLLPLLVDRPGGLLVEVTDGTADYNASHYRISVFYDLAKVAVNRLAFSQGHELAPLGATAVAITPGLAALGDDARGLRRHRGRTGATPSTRHARTGDRRRRPTSPSPSRRATSAAPSPRSPPIPTAARWNQRSVTSGQLAAEYGFTDVDGSQPDVWRYMAEVKEGRMDADLSDYR